MCHITHRAPLLCPCTRTEGTPTSQLSHGDLGTFAEPTLNQVKIRVSCFLKKSQMCLFSFLFIRRMFLSPCVSGGGAGVIIGIIFLLKGIPRETPACVKNHIPAETIRKCRRRFRRRSLQIWVPKTSRQANGLP